MYLNLLDIEKKHLFLDLELYMSNIDGEFSDEEKMIIDTHCLEMHIDNNNYIPENSLEVLMDKLKKEFSFREKKIIIFELAGTVMADGVYDGEERKLMEKIVHILGLEEDMINDAIQIITELKLVYSRCAEFIG